MVVSIMRIRWTLHDTLMWVLFVFHCVCGLVGFIYICHVHGAPVPSAHCSLPLQLMLFSFFHLCTSLSFHSTPRRLSPRHSSPCCFVFSIRQQNIFAFEKFTGAIMQLRTPTLSFPLECVKWTTTGYRIMGKTHSSLGQYHFEIHAYVCCASVVDKM